VDPEEPELAVVDPGVGVLEGDAAARRDFTSDPCSTMPHSSVSTIS